MAPPNSNSRTPAGAGEDKGKRKAKEDGSKSTQELAKTDKNPDKAPGKDGEDGKAPQDKKDAEQEDELSEEDQQLKTELEMFVERLHESDKKLYKAALEAIKDSIKTSTSSMTAVPKPLKFLRPHYEGLTELYEEWPASADKTSLADVLSVLGMTHGKEDELETLKYRLLAPSEDLGSWGHEYVRHLALEIGKEYQKRLAEEADVDELVELGLSLVPFFLKHNAEADAIDLLSEIERIKDITKYLDENTFSRVCLYMVSIVPFLTTPDDKEFLETAHSIYRHYKRLPQSMDLAIRLNDMGLVLEDLAAAKDPLVKKQLAFNIARQALPLIELDVENEEQEEVANCLGNTKLSEYFKALAKELNILEPKTPEDIYKSHLENQRTAGLTNVETSARHNLASAFVNGFVNAGYGSDKLMFTDDESKHNWIFKTKEDGMLSATASLGMLLQWDVETGLDKIDKYQYAEESEIKAGSLLALGISNAGVRIDAEPILALLGDTDNLLSSNPKIKIASIMGLGIAYAGTQKGELLELLLPIVEDNSNSMQVSAMAVLALGLVFVGSSEDKVSEAIITLLFDPEREKQLKDKWSRFVALGLALLYFGRQDEVEVILETLKAMEIPMAKPTALLCEVCAWAGTGAVLKLQELLHICNDHIEDAEESKEAKDGEDKKDKELLQSYAVLGLSLIAMGEDVGQEMVLRTFGHLMHYGEANIRKTVPLAMGLISPSNPQMKVYDTLSRYSHDNDNDVAINAIFAMGLTGAGTNNARLAQLLRQLASYYHRDGNSLFMVRIAQGLLHMGKGTMTLNPFHSDRQVQSQVASAALLTVLVSLLDAKDFILAEVRL